jgi:hypothetical protein
MVALAPALDDQFGSPDASARTALEHISPARGRADRLAAGLHRPGVSARRAGGQACPARPGSRWPRGLPQKPVLRLTFLASQRCRAGDYGLQGEVVTKHGDPPVADTEDLHE